MDIDQLEIIENNHQLITSTRQTEETKTEKRVKFEIGIHNFPRKLFVGE